jgi:ribose 5-phosphate isomerase B
MDIGTKLESAPDPGLSPRHVIAVDSLGSSYALESDDLNAICLDVLVVGYALVWELAQTFLAARFSGAERHQRCLAKVAELESGEEGT